MGTWRQVVAIVDGPAHAVAGLLRGDSRATLCGDSADSRPTAWNGRSAIWRHNKFLGAGPVHVQDNENDVLLLAQFCPGGLRLGLTANKGLQLA